MTYKKGDVLGPYSMGDCPFCEDGDLDTEGDVFCYTYYCANCEGEIDIEVNHTVTAVRPPKAK